MHGKAGNEMAVFNNIHAESLGHLNTNSFNGESTISTIETENKNVVTFKLSVQRPSPAFNAKRDFSSISCPH